MADHLFEAAGKFGLPALQAAAAQQMLASLAAENVCDYFALAHAHEHQDLMDVCAELMGKEMQVVTQSEGFKRHEQTPIFSALFKRMSQLSSPEAQSRKRKRSALSEGDESIYFVTTLVSAGGAPIEVEVTATAFTTRSRTLALLLARPKAPIVQPHAGGLSPTT